MKDSEESWLEDAGQQLPEKQAHHAGKPGSDFAHAGSPLDGEREAYQQSVLRAVPVGIGVVVNRVIRDVNPRLCDIFGYRRQELLGRNSRILYASDEDYRYVGREKYRQIAEYGTGTVETRMQCRDGRVIDVLLSSSPIDSSDLLKGVTFTVLDITAGKQAEIRLRESEEKYRSLVEQSIQGMIIGRDNPPRICFASKPMESIIGYTPGELMAFSSEELLSMVHPDEREIYYRTFRERIAGRLQQIRREFRMIHKNGQVRWVELFGTTIFYEGAPATQTVMVDISERKYAEEELLESGEKLKKLFDNIRDGLFVHAVTDSGSHGVFEMVNRSASEILGYSEQELLGMFPEDIYAPVSPDAGIALEMSLLDHSGSQLFEAVLVHKNGTRVPVEVRTSRIELSGRECTISTVRDITGRKRSHEELRKIATAVQQSPTVVVMMNAEAEIEYVNPRYTELTGYRASEVLGKYPAIMQAGMIPRDQYNRMWKTLKRGRVWRGELLDRKKSGEPYWENIIIAPVKNDQGVIANYVALAEDITEQKRLWSELVAAKEKAEESDRLKTAFLANMSHEIRTPMNGILGFSELLKDPLLSGSKKDEYIELIGQSGRRMLCILNDLIDISKIEAGEITLQYTDVCLNEVFHDLQAFFEPQATRKGLYLRCGKQLDFSDFHIETDRVRLTQILTNLLQNALKYTLSGGIEFGCTKKNDQLEFYVRDTGIGVPDHLKERIFDRFLQGHADVACKHDGVGLGLSISKSLVELLEGSIRLESSEGKGCVFYFTHPYRKVRRQEKERKPLSAPPGQKFKQDLCILVAEDDNVNRILLEKVLGGKHIDVVATVDGCQAVREVRQNPRINLVLMDIRMPGMDGYEALREIKGARPELPVIAHTAFALPEDKKNALDAGFDAFLTKPVNIDELFGLIRRFTE